MGVLLLPEGLRCSRIVEWRPGGPTEASGDVREGLSRLQPDPDLLALFRAQYCTWRAGSSNGSSLGVARSS